MPRKARIDAPGALHHIICRGIERRKIFSDDTDRDEFISRLAAVVKETQTFCYAWALIPNHFHLLLRTGATPITTVMQRLLSGYARTFLYNGRDFITFLFFPNHDSLPATPAPCLSAVPSASISCIKTRNSYPVVAGHAIMYQKR
jgi:REP element-mobilizing transposase RayT